MSEKKLKLGIVGHGFVGTATDKGFNKNVEKFIVDPRYGTSIEDLAKFKPNIVFICVPTPMSDNGEQDGTILTSVTKHLIEKCPDSIKVIKSTVLPATLKMLYGFDKNFIYNPEFLREKYADEDFVNAKFIILGGKKTIASKVADIYAQHSQCITRDFIFTELETASLVKYGINTFLATKVMFFNELYEVYKHSEMSDSWEFFKKVISMDNRIGNSHMDVPGHDGKKGFGGACFPKDANALAKYSESIGHEMKMLKKVIEMNNIIRASYEDLDEREKQQNISYEGIK